MTHFIFLLISACEFPCRTQSYTSQWLLTLVMAVLSLLKCEPGTQNCVVYFIVCFMFQNF